MNPQPQAIPPTPSSSPPIVTPPVEPPTQTKPNKILLIVGLSILFVTLAGTTGFFGYKYFQTQPSQLAPTPLPSSAPAKENDLTSTWKTFITDDKKVTFKYPADWTIDQNTTSEGWGKNITTANLKNDNSHLIVSVANMFMNECMQELSKQNITLSGTTFYKRYFTGVYLTGGEACSRKENLENLEIWLQPTNIDKEPYNYQYGLAFYYKNSNKDEAEKLFDLILSTFEFLDETTSDIQITTPLPNSTISSPLAITGQADTTWFFEGSFPVKLLDSSRNEIASSFVSEVEPGSWMNEGMIGFRGTLEFTTTATSGFLVFQADNPSGLPENNKSFELPITFAN